MQDDTNKRKYKRIEKPYMVRFRIRPDKTQEIIASDWDMVATKDIGAGGVYFIYNQKLKLGSTIDLKIGFSKDEPPIDCVGIIVRMDTHKHSSVYEVAIAFMEIKADHKNMINEVAEEEDS